MQSEYIEMMNQKYESKISALEKDLKNMDNEKQASLKKTTDTKQIQVIEQQFKAKMEDMQKQL